MWDPKCEHNEIAVTCMSYSPFHRHHARNRVTNLTRPAKDIRQHVQGCTDPFRAGTPWAIASLDTTGKKVGQGFQRGLVGVWRRDCPLECPHLPSPCPVTLRITVLSG